MDRVQIQEVDRRAQIEMPLVCGVDDRLFRWFEHAAGMQSGLEIVQMVWTGSWYVGWISDSSDGLDIWRESMVLYGQKGVKWIRT